VNRDLLFAWESSRGRQLAISGFLTLSAAGHAFCFYLFQIVYPPTVALLPPPARINFISENSDEGRTLLRWIAAEDPALATTTQRSPEAKAFALPKLSHVPSYLTIQPTLKRRPLANTEERPPSAQPPGPVPIARPQNQISRLTAPTSVFFSEETDSLGMARQPAMKFSATTRESPQSVRFRIAVGRDGVVRYCFLQNSSGDRGLDEQARRYLLLCRFSPRKDVVEGLKWTTATIEWGNDVTVPPAAAASETSP
jgi:outer membrane biosynthesis protein TonB